jgi:hypothetical protein
MADSLQAKETEILKAVGNSMWLRKSDRQKEREREVDLMAVGAVSANLCPHTQPPPRGRERGIDKEKDRRGRKRKVDLMAVGAVAAVPVLAPNLLHVVETLTPVWHALARIMRPRLLHVNVNKIIFVISRENFSL